MPEQHSPPTLDFVGSWIYAFLGVTCHLHFWQNDRVLLCAIAVTQGMNRHQTRVSTKSKLWRRKCSHHSCQDSNSQLFDRESGTLPTSCPSSQHMTESPAEYTVKAENHFLDTHTHCFVSGWYRDPGLCGRVSEADRGDCHHQKRGGE